MSTETLKCVVVGDGAVGKTCLLIRYAKNEYPDGYIPTVFDSYAVSLPVGDDSYELHLFDTAGQEDYDQLRKLAFSDTDVLLVCFSVDYFSSYENVRDVWIPEITQYCQGVPFILVATKIDLRTDQEAIEKLSRRGKTLITREQGEKLAKEIKAVKYMECSALTKENVNDVFKEAVIVALSKDEYVVPNSSTVNQSRYMENDKNNTFNPPNRDYADDDCCCSCTLI